MKILAIKGKNLASLEGEFEVDFTVEPLKSAGIFAITGSTGSGKSTLLDAICLALFNDTPRINKAADNADIADIKAFTIKQKDSRNILRRGTAEGYAEVDFVSLDGDKYRARWSVRRSRDKIDGSLQNATYKVINLSTNCELQGGKTELLAHVEDLIGLSFDQFTRAVLLAQGDFATFLKAAPKEKAEILEKLTGTDVYSRISTKIYENTKEAERELSKITERIQDVELLSDTQIIELNTEKSNLTKDTVSLDEEIKILNDKLKWSETNERLIKDVSAAQDELEKSKIAFEEAKPRFDYLARIESVQEIRDTFKQLENERKQLSAGETLLKEQQVLKFSNNDSLEKEKTALLSLQNDQNQLAEEWQKTAPKIKEFRKLDVQIEEITKIFKEAENEVSQTSNQKNKCENAIKTGEEKITSFRKSQNEITQWLDLNNSYKEVVSKIDLIVSYINGAMSPAQQVSNYEKLLISAGEILKNNEKDLGIYQVEAKRLNDLLPAEIVALRAKLINNEPCPVCGSRHHPISGISAEKSLEEKALNEAKNNASRKIEQITEKIGKNKDEIIRLQQRISGYREQHDLAFSKLAESMKHLSDWQEKYKNGTLKNELEIVANTWNENTIKQISLTEQLNIQNQEQKNNRERLADLSESLKTKQEKLTRVSTELESLHNKRKVLFNGETADNVEKLLLEKIKRVDNQIAITTESKSNLVAEGEKISGIIAQMADTVLGLKISIGSSEKTVANWLSKRTDKLKEEELAQLFSKDNVWLIAEREDLDKLKKWGLSAQSTLIERQRVAEEHQKETVKKPSERETKELLTNIHDEKAQSLNHKKNQLTEIGLIIANYNKGKERIKQFEKELAEKGVMTENWRKLNELFGSADGAKFKVLAQGYTLDVLLGYANKHLKDISKRYLLERVSPESLSLQVVDLDMLSEVRSVHSLSGGESFLISLSLALGLSSLSSNKMRVESLFIDEGFGTLDADTLRIAMDALERIQTQGRKIGVISHVVEMTERIPTQIQVVKSINGKSRIEIKGDKAY